MNIHTTDAGSTTSHGSIPDYIGQHSGHSNPTKAWAGLLFLAFAFTFSFKEALQISERTFTGIVKVSHTCKLEAH